MKKIIFSLLVLLPVLFLSQRIESQQLRTGYNLRQEKVVLPASVADKSQLVVADYEPVLDEDTGIGILVFYDDPRTKLEVDYIELYDIAGNLLLVSWIDRFGICQVAMDRGLLDEKHPNVAGVLVIMTTGGMTL
jgi:hypothetical protein